MRKKTTKRAPRKRKSKAASSPRTVVKISGTRRKRSSSAAHHKPAKRRKSRKAHGFMGSTATGMINQANIKRIAGIAMGVAVGSLASNMILRPLEAKILERWPGVAKFLGVGEILIGGMVAIKAKNGIARGVGLGVLASGVNNAIRQFQIFKHIPGVHGFDEYQTVNVPINGALMDNIAGLIKDGRRDIYTNQVAGLDNTNMIAGNYSTLESTNQVAGDWDDVMQFLPAKGAL